MTSGLLSLAIHCLKPANQDEVQLASHWLASLILTGHVTGQEQHNGLSSPPRVSANGQQLILAMMTSQASIAE